MSAHVTVFMVEVIDAGADASADDLARSIRIVGADERTVHATDLSASRGDGIFETLGVLAGRPQAVEAHLARLANSARLLELPEPNLAQWRAAIDAASAALPADEQGGIKLVLTRGVEGSGVPTGWAVATVHGNDFPEREAGYRVVTLDRGYSSSLSARAPWLLPGAKTLSYAVNLASLREAERRGADNAIWVTSDGFVMEAPQSTVVLKRGTELVTPKTDIGILGGTTELSLFSKAVEWGLTTGERLVPASWLLDSDAVWLLSSVKLATPVTAVDGSAIGVDLPLTREFNAFLLGRAE